MNNDNKNNRPDQNAANAKPAVERNSSIPNDLPDSKRDNDELHVEESFINLPDVKDIPGQEFVNTPPAGILGDTTISSDDEEGRSVFDRSDAEDLRTGNEADLTRGEKAALGNIDYMPTKDEDNLYRASMDNTDFDDESLNEEGFGEERTGVE